MVRRQELLRTRFRWDGDTMYLDTDDDWRTPLDQVDLSALPEERREAVVRRLALDHASHPFDLSRGRLFTCLLLRVGADDHALLLNMHHGISDGWSLEVLQRDLATLYDAYSHRRPSPLPELPLQYADFAAWQRARISDGSLGAQIEFWRQRMANRPEPFNFVDRPRPETVGYASVIENLFVPEALVADLRRLARRQGCSLAMVLLAAVNTLFHRYTGEEDLVLNSTFAARNRPELGALIGLFINTALLRSDLSGNPTFRDLMLQVREGVLTAYRHQDVPFPRLIAELYPSQKLSRTFFSRVNVNMLSFSGDSGPGNPDLAIETYVPINPPAKYDISFIWREVGDYLVCSLACPIDLMTADSVKRLGEDLLTLLAAAAAEPETRVGDLLPEPHYRPYRAPSPS
jgi:Condensation domain